MSYRDTQVIPLGEGTPTRAKHHAGWGAVWGDSPYRGGGLPPKIEVPERPGESDPGEAGDIRAVSGRRDVEFAGSSDDDLRDFPQIARQRAGYQLHLVQSGQDPFDWERMAVVGPGCSEIRVRDGGDAYGVYYVASLGDPVQVLHCFQLDGQESARSEIDLGSQRYEQRADPSGADTAGTRRYASVWDALEATPGATENMKIRSALMRELGAHIASAGMAESDVARRFDITLTRISDLRRGKVDLFSIDMLVNMLAAAGLHLDLRVSDAT